MDLHGCIESVFRWYVYCCASVLFMPYQVGGHGPGKFVLEPFRLTGIPMQWYDGGQISGLLYICHNMKASFIMVPVELWNKLG